MIDFTEIWTPGTGWTKLPVAEITQDQIHYNRLRRKLEKAIKQRDHYKQQLNYYQEVLAAQPYIERRYRSYLELKQETQRIRDLELRVKEQAALIKLLQKDSS